MRLCHNIGSLNILRTYSGVLQKQSTALGRISSGYKVDSAKDGPNAIAESEKMRMQIRGLQMAQRNIQDGASMLQVGEGALSNMTDMMQRIRELTVQGLNGTKTDVDKTTVQNEINQLISGINDIASNTEFNGVKLLSNTAVTDNSNPEMLKMQIGDEVGDSVEIPTYNLADQSVKFYTDDTHSKYFKVSLRNIDLNQTDIQNTTGTFIVSGLNLNGLQLYNNDGTAAGSMISSQQAVNCISDSQNGNYGVLDLIDNICDGTILKRSKYGAVENRFNNGYNIAGENSDMLESADSSLRDADIAEEMIEYTKDNVLSDAGNAMMVQSNKLPLDILNILQNVR